MRNGMGPMMPGMGKMMGAGKRGKKGKGKRSQKMATQPFSAA